MSSRSRLLARLQGPGGLAVVWQPVFELDGEDGEAVPPGSPFGWQAILRGPEDGPLAEPEQLCAFVRAKHAEAAIDRAGLAAALQAAQRLPASSILFLRVHGATIGRDHELLVFLSDAAAVNGVEPSRLVVEIAGPPPSWHEAGFRNNVAGLKAIGARLAVSLGAGASGYRAVVDCRPDYLRLHRYLVGGLHADFFRRAVVDSVAHLARTLGARVVAEGVEDERDLRELRGAGVALAQGELLTRALSTEAGVLSES
jgi:EAL domain-containing protein (putative c-di-GMP-specific phosphodiesterase class I)